MIKIFVPKVFKFLTREGERHFLAGSHIVEEAVANNWWVKAHSRDHKPVESLAPAAEQEAPDAPNVTDDAAHGDQAGSDQEAETPEEIAQDAALAAKGETKDELIKQAKELGLSVDKRWGLGKLQAAIDAKLAE